MQDEILYCARCGISFLWTQEEQKVAVRHQLTGAPTHCPGCRRLLSPAGRERGQVKWYDPRKQYGFIVRTGHPDIYVHRSGLVDGHLLRPGDLVEFEVITTERGLAADLVQIIASPPH
ncbi:MAG: cold shock domain-containing protein [Anaerolineales bacterium]|nr:cold shock domain-containing protein [Anaerolineales bacterium]